MLAKMKKCINDILRKENIKVPELAKHCKINPKNIYNILAGQAPTCNTLQKIITAKRIDPRALFDIDKSVIPTIRLKEKDEIFTAEFEGESVTSQNPFYPVGRLLMANKNKLKNVLKIKEN